MRNATEPIEALRKLYVLSLFYKSPKVLGENWSNQTMNNIRQALVCKPATS